MGNVCCSGGTAPAKSVRETDITAAETLAAVPVDPTQELTISDEEVGNLLLMAFEEMAASHEEDVAALEKEGVSGDYLDAEEDFDLLCNRIFSDINVFMPGGELAAVGLPAVGDNEQALSFDQLNEYA